MTYENKLKLAYQKIMSSKRVLLIGHLSPDPDAISSLAAVIELIKDRDIYFYAFALGKKENEFSFIPNNELIKSEPPASLSFFDLVVVFDCGSLPRTGIAKEIKENIAGRGAKKIPFYIELDHHEKTDDWSDLEIRKQQKASTSIMVYDLLKVNKITINKSLSECVLSGLMSDTGCFLYSNASAQAIAVASEMLNYGASFNKLLRAMTQNSNLLSLKIWGKAIENLHFNTETGLASSGLNEAELKELKENFKESKEVVVSDLFGIITSFISSLEGVKVALLLREEDGIIKASLRTNDNNVNVSYLASKFGGGGHKKAAGFSITGSLVKTSNGWKVRKK